jgi:hypothetical protein
MDFARIIAHSIYSCFANMGRFVTLKKSQVQNMDLKKVGCKKQAASSLFE